MHTDRCGNIGGQKCHIKGSRKETTRVNVQRYKECGIQNV